MTQGVKDTTFEPNEFAFEESLMLTATTQFTIPARTGGEFLRPHLPRKHPDLQRGSHSVYRHLVSSMIEKNLEISVVVLGGTTIPPTR